MNASSNPRAWLLALCILWGTSISAQDIHFSQFWNAPMTLNPALTGVFEGDLRAYGIWRQQWWTVPVNYRTINAAADFRLYNRASQTSPGAIGVFFNYDVAGDSRLNITQFQLSGSYSHQITKRNTLTYGGMVGVAQRRLSYDDLRWENQYLTGNGSGEEEISENNLYADLAGGINWRYIMPDRDSIGYMDRPKLKFDLGIGVFHVNQPQINFFSGDERLPSRYSIYAMTTFKIPGAEKLDAEIRATTQFQGSYQEVLLAGGILYHHDPNPRKYLAYQVGMGTRFNDALFLYAGMYYKNWHFGGAYDFNTSDFDVATNGQGAYEVYLRYILRTVKPVPVKFCPIYL